MKRVIPFLLLACVAVACKEDGPTVPGDGLRFGIDCQKVPNHPKCTDDGGDGGGGETGPYIATDLETRHGRTGPTWAYDVSDDLGNGTVTIAGGTRVGNQYLQATTWTVTGTDVVDGPVLLALEDPAYQDVFAFGISDNGSYIVGRARESTETSYADWVRVSAVRWYEGGPGYVLDPVEDYDRAIAVDVNTSGKTVGYSTRDTGEPPLVATVWDESGYPSELDSPPGLEGGGIARGINNDGDVVGASWDGEQWHAILWPYADAPCDLGVGYAQDITDENSGTILVAGDWGTPEVYQPAVWRIDPTATSCSDVVLERWTIDSGSQTSAWDVRRVGTDGWEAVGYCESDGEQPPLVWRFDGTEITEIQLAADGRALGINNDGQIAGDATVKRLKHAMLWTLSQ